MPEDRVVETTRPATVATTVIRINGAAVPEKYKAEAIVITNEVNRVPTAKVVIIDGAPETGKFDASNEPLFVPGSEIEILAGYASDNQAIYKGIIIKHSLKIRGNGASVLVLDCKDKVVKMTIGAKNKYFSTDAKDSDAIQEICGTYSGVTADIEATTVTHKRLVQYSATDWDFILSRADVNGKVAITDGGKLTIKKPDLAQSPVLTLVYGATILELDAEIDARQQFKGITAKSWSSKDGAVVEKEVADPGITGGGNLTPASLADVAAPDSLLLQHGGEIAEPELEAWGTALWQKHELAKVRGRVRFRGTHTVKTGMMLELQGVGDRFNGKCFISGVHHHISSGDWQTDAQLGMNPEWFTAQYEVSATPASGLLPAVSGLQIGVVTQLESDPEGANRIQVYLPVIKEGEQGTWARVATLDAGNERGSFFLPEIGDEVIVGFINDDPREAVVLGMLNSAAKPAPLKAEDANKQKGFVTRSKMKLIFDDDKKSFTLETPAGKKLTLDEDAGAVQLEDENGNQLIMNSDGIQLKSKGKIEIKATQDFKCEGLNTEIKGSAGFKAEGGASADLKSGGATTVKGSVVQIN